MSPAELETYLHRHIPLSAAMGVEVIECARGRVVLSAPLEPNVNHRETGFGGSVATLAILAGWARVHFAIREDGHEVHTVIHRSSVSYDAPIESTFRAVTEPIADESWDRLRRGLARRGKGRVRVDVRIETEGKVVARFQGAYVALRIASSAEEPSG